MCQCGTVPWESVMERVGRVSWTVWDSVARDSVGQCRGQCPLCQCGTVPWDRVEECRGQCGTVPRETASKGDPVRDGGNEDLQSGRQSPQREIGEERGRASSIYGLLGLFLLLSYGSAVSFERGECNVRQGYVAHKKTPTPLGPP